MSSQPLTHLTHEQYLEIERKAEFPSEYINGEMFAMSGGTKRHARIGVNALTSLAQQLRGRPCDAYGGEFMRVHAAKYNVSTYPDVTVACGAQQALDDEDDTLTDATVIIEILSPSTKNYDRGEKFLYYRSLPSFSEYLLLSQDAIRAEHHVRQPDGSWLFREFTSRSDEIELKSIGCRLQLETLYERVKL